jgi:2-polyprenyl-3-methyl-5-hydroxy-6-metoxy-1,4-benzoquinol methylase
MLSTVDPTRYPALSRAIEVQLRVWPEHAAFLQLRFQRADLGFAERLAGLVARATDAPDVLAADYRWFCERMNEEELHFRRTNRYRLSTFAEAEREVYSNREFMRRYMNGQLLSLLWWDNHARVIEHYADRFLSSNRDGYRHLEIGPGHGLLLYLAATDPRCASASGWDVSETSIAATRAMLARLGVTREVALIERDLMADRDDEARFDSIVISEVCEHLEDPRAALVKLRRHLAPGGRLFVNVPINGPAPDHIYLLRTPEDGVELVRSAGLEIVGTALYPMTGLDERRARRLRAAISCIVVGTVGAAQR